MRRIAPPVAVLALMVSGAAVMAATTPSPSPSASAHPSATPHASASPSATPKPTAQPTATPSPSPSPSPSSSPTTSPTTTGNGTRTAFTGSVTPLVLGGSARIEVGKDGRGLVLMKLTGLVDDETWSVDIDGGTVAVPNENAEIAERAGTRVTRLGTDGLRIVLSKAEVAALMHAAKHGGAVAVISDGTREASVEFAGS